MTIIEIARALRQTIEAMAENLDDETALDNIPLFPSWSGEGVVYEVDKKVRYNNILYKVIQEHTSQPDWSPDVAVSLFARVLIPDPEIIPEWVQPDSTNPYMIGDKVTYNGQVWISIIDNNVWSPDTYGWEVVESSE